MRLVSRVIAGPHMKTEYDTTTLWPVSTDLDYIDMNATDEPHFSDPSPIKQEKVRFYSIITRVK